LILEQYLDTGVVLFKACPTSVLVSAAVIVALTSCSYSCSTALTSRQKKFLENTFHFSLWKTLKQGLGSTSNASLKPGWPASAQPTPYFQYLAPDRRNLRWRSVTASPRLWQALWHSLL
jgi:hypothetical protein